MAEACVRLFNAGNRRVKVQTLTLVGGNGQQALSFKDGQNVLAGDEREWRVPLTAAVPGLVQGGILGVRVDTALGETLHAEAGGF
jgi:fimbrial chaperone protein